MVAYYEDITVVVPHIPVRAKLLKRALRSILLQQTLPQDVAVVTDVAHEGAAATRNRGLFDVETEFVAFLDDDDYLGFDHIDACLDHLREHVADVVYPWFNVANGQDPLGMFGKPFDAEHLKISNYIPITVVARTKTLQDVGGFTRHPETGDNPCEDWHCWLKVHNAGGKIVHLPQKTWVWDHATGNTSGRGDHW